MSKSKGPVKRLPALVVMGLGGRGAAMAVNMLVLVMTSRLMPPAAFGEFAICQFVVDLGQAASMAFISVPLLQHRRIRGTEYRFTLAITLGLALAAAIGLLASAGTIASWMRMPGLESLLFAVVPILASRIVASFFTGVLQRRVRIAALVRAQSASQILSALAVTLPLAFMGFGAWSLVIGLGVATAIELAMLFRSTGHSWRPYFSGDVRALTASGWPTLLNRSLIFFSDATDRVVVGRAFGVQDLGIYSRSASLVRLPVNLLGLPLQSALMAWFSRYKGKTELIRDALGKAVEIQSFLLPVAMLGLWIATPALVLVMLGNQWEGAIPIAQILFIGSFARLGAMPLESASLTLGHAWSSAGRQAIATVVLLSGFAIGVGQSPIWIAAAVSASRVVYYLLGLRFGMRVFRITVRSIIHGTVGGLLVAALAGGMTFTITQQALARGVAASILELATFATVSLLVTLIAPERMVGPIAPFLRIQLRRMVTRSLSNNRNSH